ncbi:hypothetical protein N7478_005418 [Penicillium angulare]|uniref:uncharacterized protein n=1 Tax=Penicillium angulare TaxID=116970 RepID=UPI0025401305|nr:uncharacterized protein N7478_005418 [Penicillium angulare]KAJ5280046.1 hypothetical protein N7478_005418 [Penicillium angulare]
MDEKPDEVQEQPSPVENELEVNTELQRSHSQPTAILNKSSEGEDEASGHQSSRTSMRKLPSSAIQTQNDYSNQEEPLPVCNNSPILITRTSPTLHRNHSRQVDLIASTTRYATRFYRNRADIEDISSPAENSYIAGKS